METENLPSLASQITSLDIQVERLLVKVRDLQAANQSLVHKLNELSDERAELLAQKEQARSRVEAIISRLKMLEEMS